MFSRKFKERLAHYANGIAALATVATAVSAVLFPPAALALGIFSGLSWGVGVLFQYSADKERKVEEAVLKARLEGCESVTENSNRSDRMQEGHMRSESRGKARGATQVWKHKTPEQGRGR